MNIRIPTRRRPEQEREYLPRLQEEGLSPLFAASSSLSVVPSAFVFTVGHDALRNDGLFYVQRLRSAHVTVANRHFAQISWMLHFRASHEICELCNDNQELIHPRLLILSIDVETLKH